MSWLTEPPADVSALRAQLRTDLASPEILLMPGAHDPLAGQLAKQAGFRALYLSGAAETARHGYPDIELATAPEFAASARDLVRATGLPVLVDCDTGFGGPLSVARTAREVDAAGGAAIQLEDQASPKRCGHLAGKSVVSVADMVDRIRAARTAVPDLVIVARSDARAVEGLAGMVDRLNAYAEAGADCLFPEALTSEDEYTEVRSGVTGALLANMTEFGVSPLLPAARLQELGYQAVIYPVSSLRAAAGAVRALYAELRDTGTTAGHLDRMLTRADLYAAIRYADYSAMEDAITGRDPLGPPRVGAE